MNVSVTISSEDGYVEATASTEDGAWPPELLETVLARLGSEALRLHRERTPTSS